MINLELKPKYSEIFRSAIGPGKTTYEDNIRFVGSGKAAIGLILQYMTLKGILDYKMSPIFVPPWMGTWVYASFLPYAFPVLEPNDTKVIWCYHQYGFPQDMDRLRDFADSRKMIVIEDCAHTCDSKYNNQSLGTFGDFSLYSFSKFYFSFALGGVWGRDADFFSFVEDTISKSPSTLRFITNTFKFFDTIKFIRRFPLFANLMDAGREMNYAIYYRQPIPGKWGIRLWLKAKNQEKKMRHKNYSLLWEETIGWGLCDHLEENGVIPYAVPLAVPNQKVAKVIRELNSVNIWAGFRRFDVARCMFEPDYQKCVLVPIHSGMTGAPMAKLLDVLKRNFS
jgi:hypothetical protein